MRITSANGYYPDNQDGLKVLTPEFIKVLQNDPWGRPYQYVQPGKAGPFDIICYGADGREGGTGLTPLPTADVAAPADRRVRQSSGDARLRPSTDHLENP